MEDSWSGDGYPAQVTHYLYQDKVGDHQRNVPANAYSTDYYRARSASTPNKYTVKPDGPRGGVAREFPEAPPDRGYLLDSGGYAPDSAESNESDMTYDSKAHLRYKKREPHSRRPPTSTQAHIAQLEQEKMGIMEEINHVDRLKEDYSEQLKIQSSLLNKTNPSSQEYAEIQRNTQKIIEEACRIIGTAADDQFREQEWRQRLLEIEHRLASFKHSRFQPVSSPENSQVSSRDQWNSPPLSYTSDGYHEQSPHHTVHHHSLNLRPPHESADSGFKESQSDVTSSSHTPHGKKLQPDTRYKHVPDMPHIFRQGLVRSASTDDNLAPEQNEVTEVLAKIGRPTHRRRATAGHIPLSSLSQSDRHSVDHHYAGRYGFQSPSQLSLSQSSHPLRYYDDPYYPHRKRGSPASSSDTSSIASDVRHRLASGPGSVVSFQSSVLSNSTGSSLNSSRSGSKGILPRPTLTSSGSFSSKSHRYTSIPEYPRHTASEVGGFMQYLSQSHTGESDSEREDEAVSMPVLPTTSKSTSHIPSRVAPPPPGRHGNGSEGQRVTEVHKRKKTRSSQPRIPEEGNRDSLQLKIEMVLSVLSVVNSSSKEQHDADAVKFLLALSRTPDTCAVMRQPGCMNMLIQILHNIRHKGQRSHREVRARAAETLRNIIQSTGDTRQGKHELCVLGVLEKIRSHCDTLFDYIASHQDARRLDPADLEGLQHDCDELLSTIRKLYKFSSDKEKYRPAILNIGGLQATAEVLIVNFRLIAFQDVLLRAEQKPVCHSSKIVTAIISILINLTYGDVNNKSELCNLRDFLKSLVFHIKQQNESIIASSAQVLRNLSWRATADIKEALQKCEAANALTGAIKYISDEPTIQYTTSALWNLSAHSLESRRKICTTAHGIQQLVELLSYNSPSGTPAVIENVGGILKNLSVVIMQEEKFRRKFREAGGFAKLAQHLKSKNKTVLANATGILWNLSSRCREDQKMLWNLGCVPLLDVHATSEHRPIAENARGALRNLLSFGQHNGYSSKTDVDGLNLKTQQGLSKSLCYATNYTFGQPSPHQKRSTESLHSRSSQPLPGHSKSNTSASTFSLTQPGKAERRGEQKFQYPGEGEVDEYTKKTRNNLKLSRIQSAPQASAGTDEQDENEWASYMPYQERVNTKPYANEAPRPKKNSKRGNAPYCLSQTVSSNSLNAVTMSLSPVGPLSSDVPTGLSALEAGFDPNQPEQTHEVYAELDPLDLEDETEDIDLPIRREEHGSGAELYQSPRIRRSLAHHEMPSPGKLGTGKLALDGSVIHMSNQGEKC